MSHFELQKMPSTIRKGTITTPHGDLSTPFFMPIATRAAVKTLSAVDMEKLGTPIVLSNTFHLMLRPGMEVMKAMGGLHAFMGWNGAILTDSGGYQVFSLADRRKVTEEGVAFQSPIDGSKHLLTPESSIEIQLALGSDIVMCFDEVIALPADQAATRSAVERTERWAKRCKETFESKIDSSINPGAQLFGIIQGGTDHDLRKQSAEGMLKIGFDGYAIGGLSVGEPFEQSLEVLDRLMPLLPADKPRYFMGGAQPHQIVEYVKRGIDMFDCVLPTRNARHGHLYRWVHDDLSKPDFYETVNIINSKWKGSVEQLLDPKIPNRSEERSSPVALAKGEGARSEKKEDFEGELSRFSLGYLHHLFDIKEILAYRLATVNNLMFYLKLFEILREE
ncbi:MAG: tRNA guanosine(34) transglycosylase Tgt [Patescibacteria group bacterium]